MGNFGSSVPSTSSSTHVVKKVFYNDWTINDFSMYGSDTLTSATFSSGEAPSTKWYYRLHKGRSAERQGYLEDGDIVLEAVVLSCSPEYHLFGTVEIQMPVTVLERMEKTKISGRIRTGSTIGPLKISEKVLCFICPDALMGDRTDRLNLSIKLTLVRHLPSIGGCAQITEPPSKLTTDLGDLFANHKYCDVVIAVGGKEFVAHRAILSARSPVFAAMLDNGMIESQKQRVEIQDIEPNVFKELLRFIYTDETLNLDQHAHVLLPLADKYALDKLKVKCEISLYEHLSVETAISTLVLAELHRSDQLKKAAIDYIVRNREMITSPEWIKVMANYPELSAQIMSELMKVLTF